MVGFVGVTSEWHTGEKPGVRVELSEYLHWINQQFILGGFLFAFVYIKNKSEVGCTYVL